MSESKITRALEVATSIVVLLTAIAVSTFFLVNYYRHRQPAALELESGLEKTRSLPSIEGVTYADSARTLLLVLNARCGYCADSVRFYNRVVEAQINAGSSVKIVALFPNPDAEVKKFVAEQRLKARVISGASLAKLKLTGAPTLVLVDGAGRVQDFWIGKLTPEAEQQVLKSVAEL